MIVAISGHRKIQGKTVNEKYSSWLNSQIDEIIVRAKSKEPPVFLCGGDPGLPRLFAWRAINLDCQLDLYLPYLGFDDNHDKTDQADLSMLMTKVRRVLYLDEPGYDPRKMTNRNLTMLDQSDFLIAIMTRRGSGTSHTVNEALKRGMRVYLINPLAETAEWRRSDVQPVPDDVGGRIWTKRTAPPTTSHLRPRWTVELVSCLDPGADEKLAKCGVLAQSGHWIPEYLAYKYPAWSESGGGGEVASFSEGDRDLHLYAMQRGLLQDQSAAEFTLGKGGAVSLHDLHSSGDGYAQGHDSVANRGNPKLPEAQVRYGKVWYPSGGALAGVKAPKPEEKKARKPSEARIRGDQERLEKWQQATQ